MIYLCACRFLSSYLHPNHKQGDGALRQSNSQEGCHWHVQVALAPGDGQIEKNQTKVINRRSCFFFQQHLRVSSIFFLYIPSNSAPFLMIGPAQLCTELALCHIAQPASGGLGLGDGDLLQWARRVDGLILIYVSQHFFMCLTSKRKLTVAVASLPSQPGIMSSSACAQQVAVPELSVSHHTHKHLIDIRKKQSKNAPR